MLVILQPNDVPNRSEEEKYVILTIQPRIAVGTLRLTELPAGMVDDGTFSGAAAKEIKEELDLVILESELTNLSKLAVPEHEHEGGEKLPQGTFPSAGGCDESIIFFLCEKRVERKTLEGLMGKQTGLPQEMRRSL